MKRLSFLPGSSFKTSILFPNRVLAFSVVMILLGGLTVLIFTSFNTPTIPQKISAEAQPDWKLPEIKPDFFGTWQTMSGGVAQGAVRALATDDQGNLFVGGSFYIAGGLQERYFAKWNGSSWGTAGATAGFGGWIYDLAWANDGNLYATGDFESAWILDDLGNVAGSGNAGKYWYAMGEGFNLEGMRLMTDVYSRLYAAGHFGIADGISSHGLVRWHEDHWENFEPSMYFDIKGMTSDENGVFYGAGHFKCDPLNIDASHGILKYDGEEWIKLGEADHIIYDIALDTAGNVIVVGSFLHIDDIQAYHMAKWNGVYWQGIDVPASYQPEKVIIDGDNNIYIAGGKPSETGYWDGFVARWNGLYWQQLGENFDLSVDEIAIDVNGNFYAAGEFISSPLFHIAQFSEQVTPFPAYPPQVWVKDDTPGMPDDVQIFPNPVSQKLHISSLEKLSEIIIHNTSGNEILSIKSPGNEIDISDLPPGIYFLQWKLKQQSKVISFVVE